jgi:hypothetical protein
MLTLGYLIEIKNYVATNDVAGFEKIKAMLEHPDQIHTLQANQRYGIYQNSLAGPAVASVPNNYHNGVYQVAYRAGISKTSSTMRFCSMAV